MRAAAVALTLTLPYPQGSSKRSLLFSSARSTEYIQYGGTLRYSLSLPPLFSPVLSCCPGPQIEHGPGVLDKLTLTFTLPCSALQLHALCGCSPPYGRTSQIMQIELARGSRDSASAAKRSPHQPWPIHPLDAQQLAR